VIAFVGAVSPSVGVAGAAAAYLLVGGVVGAMLRRRDAEPATAWAALVVWPLLLPVLTAGADPVGDGPLAAQIGVAFAAIERAAALPGATDPAWAADLSGLRRALVATDRRLALVDRLLAESPGGAETRADADALRAARAHTAAGVLDVLADLERLRLQLGLLVLSGEGARVTSHLRDLRARVAALDEVGT
jgi:hypothetical protein